MKKLWIYKLLISTVWLFFKFYVSVIDNNCDVLIVSVMIMSAVRGQMSPSVASGVVLIM